MLFNEFASAANSSSYFGSSLLFSSPLETRFDALAGQLSLECLCVYDARRFSSGDFLRAVKCHRDHSRYPIVLG